MAQKDASSRQPRIREWKGLEAVTTRLIPNNRDSAVGVLLLGPIGAGDEKALELAKEQAPDPVVIRPTEGPADKILETLAQTLEPGEQLSLYEARSFPVVVVLHLEDYSVHVHGYLKGMLERPRVPWLCIASCERREEVPEYLWSMFYQVRALKAGGRPRKTEAP